MRVAFDGNKAAKNRAGLGNYSRFVIKTFAERFPDCAVDVYVSKNRHPELLAQLAQCPNVTIRSPRNPLLKLFPALWQAFCVPRELEKTGTDVWHGLGNVLPGGVFRAKKVKKIVTIHDLIFLILPHTYSWINRHIFNIRFRSACRKADRIIAVSQRTATDIHKYYRIDEGKIRVAYQGCHSSFRQKCSAEQKAVVKRRYSLPEKFILSVGTIEERKNTSLIVKALSELPDWHLVIVGKRTPYTKTVEESAATTGVASRLHILTGVTLAELPSIYQLADIFAYPSVYEGFGIPILEALCSGTPVVAATGSCLEEAGGPDTIYISPDDPHALAEAISKISVDITLRNDMITKGLVYANTFSDSALADALMSVYNEVIPE